MFKDVQDNQRYCIVEKFLFTKSLLDMDKYYRLINVSWPLTKKDFYQTRNSEQ